MSEHYWNKNVFNLKKGMQIKDIDKLPNWLIQIAEGITNPQPGSVAEIIHKQDDGNNNIFLFNPSSEEAFIFQGTERAKQIKAIPEFVDSINNALSVNIAYIRCTLSLMSLILQITLRVVKRDKLYKSEKLFIK